MTAKEIVGLQLDPQEETADANTDNNFWPRRPIEDRFQLFREDKARNVMQELKEAEKPAAPSAP